MPFIYSMVFFSLSSICNILLGMKFRVMGMIIQFFRFIGYIYFEYSKDNYFVHNANFLMSKLSTIQPHY